jgi:hypothetical protein
MLLFERIFCVVQLEFSPMNELLYVFRECNGILNYIGMLFSQWLLSVCKLMISQALGNNAEIKSLHRIQFSMSSCLNLVLTE